jgi:hypothetical protein
MREQMVLTDPVPPRPCFLGLRLWFWNLAGYVTYAVGLFDVTETRAATLRWTLGNYRKPRTCNCGAPGTVRVVPVKSETSYRGDMPPWFWRCDEHADISLQVCWAGTVPLVGQSREECSWAQSRNDTGLVTICGCGTHVGQQWKR